jgi:hypothetical protein
MLPFRPVGDFDQRIKRGKGAPVIDSRNSALASCGKCVFMPASHKCRRGIHDHDIPVWPRCPGKRRAQAGRIFLWCAAMQGVNCNSIEAQIIWRYGEFTHLAIGQR